MRAKLEIDVRAGIRQPAVNSRLGIWDRGLKMRSHCARCAWTISIDCSIKPWSNRYLTLEERIHLRSSTRNARSENAPLWPDCGLRPALVSVLVLYFWSFIFIIGAQLAIRVPRVHDNECMDPLIMRHADVLQPCASQRCIFVILYNKRDSLSFLDHPVHTIGIPVH